VVVFVNGKVSQRCQGVRNRGVEIDIARRYCPFPCKRCCGPGCWSVSKGQEQTPEVPSRSKCQVIQCARDNITEDGGRGGGVAVDATRPPCMQVDGAWSVPDSEPERKRPSRAPPRRSHQGGVGALFPIPTPTPRRGFIRKLIVGGGRRIPANAYRPHTQAPS